MTRVLLMRAEEDAARTAQALRALGHEPVFSPALEIVATGATPPAGPFDALLATSFKGVDCALGDLASRAVSAHVVGARTAAAMAARGVSVELVAENAAALAAAVCARYSEPARFLYLAGRDRRDALEAGLAAAGHGVTTAETYEARAATRLAPGAEAALKEGDLAAALHYSGRSAQIFCDLVASAGLAGAAARLLHIAISADAAAPLAALKACVRIAARPNEAEMLKLLVER